MRKVFILEHVRSEKAGTILDYLRRKKIPYQEIKLFKKGFKLPDLKNARALVVMGGPMNVDQEKEFPFLKKENLYIQKAVQKKIPFLGVCLGSQLLAKALGASVYKAVKPEVGWMDVRLTGRGMADPVFKALGKERLRVLQWHEDTFDLPKGSHRLASSALVPNQAYQVGDLFYGFQFHVEVTRAMLEGWFKKKPELSKILAEHDRYKTSLKKITDRIYGSFFDLGSNSPLSPRKARL